MDESTTIFNENNYNFLYNSGLRLVKVRTFLKKKFFGWRSGVGEIIPFPVWKILFPVFKTGFEPFNKS